MSRRNRKSKFELVIQNDNSIILKPFYSNRSKVILHSFDEEDVKNLSQMAKEVSESYRLSENSVLKTFTAVKDFLMM